MLKVQSQIVKVETMSDRGMKLTVHTAELQPEDKAELMRLHNLAGWFVFNDTAQIEEGDIPDAPVEFSGRKTPSERLHNVLFRLHEKQGGKPEDFEPWRIQMMEKIINHYKSKLDDLVD